MAMPLSAVQMSFSDTNSAGSALSISINRKSGMIRIASSTGDGTTWSEGVCSVLTLVQVRETRSASSQKRSERGRKYWQRVEPDIHSLNRWPVKYVRNV